MVYVYITLQLLRKVESDNLEHETLVVVRCRQIFFFFSNQNMFDSLKKFSVLFAIAKTV